MASVKKNYFYAMLYEILVIIVPLITAPYVARVLGVAKLGMYSSAHTIVNYFILFARLGVVNHGGREIAKAKTQEERNRIFSNVFAIQSIATVVVALVYTAYLFITPKNFLMSAIMFFYMATALIDVTWLFNGVEDFKFTSLRNMFFKLLNTSLIFILVKDEDDLMIYAIILSACYFVNHLTMWFKVFKYVRFVRPQLSIMRANLKPMLVLFIPAIAVSLYKYLDRIMLDIMCGEVELEYYASAAQINSIPLSVITALGTIMMPRISALAESGDNKKSLEYTKNTLLFVACVSSAMAFGMAAIAPNFIPLYYGEEFAPASNVLVALSSTLVFLSWANVIRTQYLIPYKKDKLYIISLFAGAAVNIITNIIFIIFWKSFGAALATILAEFTVCLLQTMFTRKVLNVKESMKQGSGFLIIGAIMYAVIALVCPLIPVNDILMVILQVGIGAAVYILLSLIYVRFIIKFPLMEILFSKKKKVAVAVSQAHTPSADGVSITHSNNNDNP